MLATPTTLIALLRTVAHGWSHEALAERAREIHELGRELHDRLGSMGGHLDKVGRSLNAAVGHYNAPSGSIESRVLVTARQFEDTVPAPRHGRATSSPGRTADRAADAADAVDLRGRPDDGTGESRRSSA